MNSDLTLTGLVTHRLSILSIEDDPQWTSLIERCLSDVAEVYSANTIEAACVHLQSVTFDAVLLDLGLPDAEMLSGLESVRELTKAPIIVLTSASDSKDELAQRAVLAGASDWLEKGTTGAAMMVRTVRLAIVHAMIKKMRSAVSG